MLYEGDSESSGSDEEWSSNKEAAGKAVSALFSYANESQVLPMPHEDYYEDSHKLDIDRDFKFIQEMSPGNGKDPLKKEAIPEKHNCVVHLGECCCQKAPPAAPLSKDTSSEYMSERRWAFLSEAMLRVEGTATYSKMVDAIIASVEMPPYIMHRGFIHVPRVGAKPLSWLQRIFQGHVGCHALEVYWLKPYRGEPINLHVNANYVMRWSPSRGNTLVWKFPIQEYRTEEFWRGLLWRLFGRPRAVTNEHAYLLVGEEDKRRLQLPEDGEEVPRETWVELLQEYHSNIHHEPFDYSQP